MHRHAALSLSLSLSLCGVLLCAAACAATTPPRRVGGRWRAQSTTDGSHPSRPSTVNCTWRTFHQQVDHFGSGTATFPQRYCTYSKWWRSASHGGFAAHAAAPGPILFYTGNESPVEECERQTPPPPPPPPPPPLNH